MNSKYMALVILVILVAMPLVSADNHFEIDIEPVDNIIGAVELATFNITITNLDTEDNIYRFGLDPANNIRWSINPTRLSVGAGQSESVLFTLRQKSFVRGIFSVTLNTRLNREIVQSDNLRVTVSPEALGGFPVSVGSNLQVPQEFDPRNTLNIQHELVNRNSRDIDNLLVSITSEFFDESYSTGLDPQEETSREYSFQLSDLTLPGTYYLRTTIINPETDETISSNRFNLNVIAYADLEVERSSNWNWFKTNRVYAIQNKGNVDLEDEFYVDLNLVERLFTSSSEDYEVVERNESTVLMYEVMLSPGESQEVTVNTDFRIPVILLVLALIMLFTYMKLRSPLIIVKGALLRKKEEESKDLKVRIFLRNRSNKPIYNITVSDRLPKITEYVKDESLGSLKPSRVKKSSKKGTYLFWDIEKLESQEERILTYNAKSQLPVIGNISLKPTKARFEEQNGRERTTISKNVTFED